MNAQGQIEFISNEQLLAIKTPQYSNAFSKDLNSAEHVKLTIPVVGAQAQLKPMLVSNRTLDLQTPVSKQDSQ